MTLLQIRLSDILEILLKPVPVATTKRLTGVFKYLVSF